MAIGTLDNSGAVAAGKIKMFITDELKLQTLCNFTLSKRL